VNREKNYWRPFDVLRSMAHGRKRLSAIHKTYSVRQIKGVR